MTRQPAHLPGPARVFVVAGEHSGDTLGAALVAELKRRYPGALSFQGVGGHQLHAAGMPSLFPLDDIAVMGPFAILKRLPTLIARVYATVRAAVAFAPDVVVIIDAPEFTHQVAKRIRRRLPRVPIIDYVSPSVWAWRPGRAAKMTAYVDHVLALLPFEPEAHRALGGPPCTYVGHPLLERLPAIAAINAPAMLTKLGLDPTRPLLVVLPGSRGSEVERLMDVFGQAVALVRAQHPNLSVVIPAMPGVRARILDKLKAWPPAAGRPTLIDASNETEKYAAFKQARAALAASGTVTLELAMTGTPMAVAYRVDAVISTFRHLIKAKAASLPNLVTHSMVVPEFLQENCTAEKLAAELLLLIADGKERRVQLAALAQVPRALGLPPGQTPSSAAAAVVSGYLTQQPATQAQRSG